MACRKCVSKGILSRGRMGEKVMLISNADLIKVWFLLILYRVFPLPKFSIWNVLALILLPCGFLFNGKNQLTRGGICSVLRKFGTRMQDVGI